MEIGGYDVTVRDLPHKGGRTVGLRVERGGSSFAYVPDHAPAQLGAGARGDGVVHGAVRSLVEGVDLLLHDAQHTLAEYPSRAHYGHTTIDYARELAVACGVGRLILFHHDPNRTDDELDRLREVAAGWPVATDVARQDDVLEVISRAAGSSTGTPRTGRASRPTWTRGSGS